MSDLEKKKAKKKVTVGPVRKPRERYATNNETNQLTTSPESSVFFDGYGSKTSKTTKQLILSPENSIFSEESLQSEADAIKTTDFVLVYKKDISEESSNKIETFVFNLEQKGFELENATFSLDENIIFIKIHAPKGVLLGFAEMFGIELTFHAVTYRVDSAKPYRCMATELTDPDPHNPIIQRAKRTFLGLTPTSITSAEKGLIIFKALSRNAFGDGKHEYGIEKLIKSNVFEAAFPLHDGPVEWTDEGPLNDRQLLARYWSKVKCWYKIQPLDLIEKYYGPETAFYFAWAGFYNKMLIPAGVMGLGFFLAGMIYFYRSFTIRNKEICESDLLLCPRCIQEYCKYEPLKNTCFHAKLMYLFDNPLVIAFAALISVWSTLFFELWRREEAMLQIRWNLKSIEVDCSLRPEFEEKATHFKLSPVTGAMEPYMKKKQIICRYTVTFSIIILLILLLALGIFGIMVYVKTISVILAKQEGPIEMPVDVIAGAVGGSASVALIISFEFCYERIAIVLTKMENPRTQMDFDNSYIYKSYALAFVNNYSVIFYLVFLKTRFYTYPGDKAIFEKLGGIGSDLCDPSGCIVQLGMQLVLTLLGKKLLSSATQYLMPRLQLLAKKCLWKNKSGAKEVQWESDYLLNPIAKYHILEEYRQMVIQYGFVTFFLAAFPPAPLLALVTNLIEIRVDANKLTHSFRRPIALKVPNLAAWNGIMHGITYIGVATNAFVIAFTSEFVQRVIYKEHNTNNLQGYIGSVLSAFNTSEFDIQFEPHKNVSVCYYPGKRYPPDHPNKYQLTNQYWYLLTMKFLAVVVFEHVVMVVTGIISYIIPDIPFSVKEHINFQRDKIKEEKLKVLRETYLKEQDMKTDIFREI